MFSALACITILCVTGQAVAQNTTTCDKTSACSCKMSDGSGIIDLKPVETGSPTYKDQLATTNKDDYLYSWNPCTPFTEGPAGDASSCTDMAACQIDKDKTNFFGLGTHDSVQFQVDVDPDTGKPVVMAIYQASESGRSSAVQLMCTSGSTIFNVHGEVNQGNYVFQLSSPCCCPGAGPGCVGGGLSGGSIILIVAVSVIIVYFVGGVIVMKFVKKAQGIEVLPNSGFWTSMPGYIKDGAVFVISPCRRSAGKYDSI